MNRTLAAFGGAAVIALAALGPLAAAEPEPEAEAAHADHAAMGEHAPHDAEEAAEAAAMDEPAMEETEATPETDADTAELIAQGEAAFRGTCGSCHAVEVGKPSYAGPNIAGIVGREAAAGEFRYSPALRNSGIVWTPEKLDTFLANPSVEVPGIRMFVRTADAEKRAAIIAFLAQTGG